MDIIKSWRERSEERGIGSCEARDDELVELRQALSKANQDIASMGADLREIQKLHDLQKAALYKKLADLSAELKTSPTSGVDKHQKIGVVYSGSGTRDGFRIVWSEDHQFPDGATTIYACSATT